MGTGAGLSTGAEWGWSGSAQNTNAMKRLEFQVLLLDPMGVGPESRPRPLRREAQPCQTTGFLSVGQLFGVKGSWARTPHGDGRLPPEVVGRELWREGGESGHHLFCGLEQGFAPVLATFLFSC